MNMNALRLPWTLQSMPHGVLDIIRGCNISCRACYNTRPAATKPLDLIREELDLLMAARRLQTVTISGGEATLHPGLCDVVGLVKSRNLRAVLITNGLLLEPGMLGRLRDAGLDMVMVHIDSSQRRADLAPDAGHEDIRELRRAKAAMIAAAGINVGLAATLFRSRPQETLGVVDQVLQSPHINYLLATNCTQFSRLKAISGDLQRGLSCHGVDPGDGDKLSGDVLTAAETATLLEAERQLKPFASLGSNLDRCDPRWFSYTVGVVRRADGQCIVHPLAPSMTERLAIRLIRWLTGRYLFYQDETPWRFRVQLLANGLTGGRLAGNFKFLAGTFGAGRSLSVKHLVFQTGPTVTPDGELIHCLGCPDATVRDGHVVPSCLSDKVEFSVTACSTKGEVE